MAEFRAELGQYGLVNMNGRARYGGGGLIGFYSPWTNISI